MEWSPQMKARARLNNLFLYAAVTGCAIPGSGKVNRPTNEIDSWLPPSTGAQFNFKERCGVDSTLPEGSVVFEQNLRSLSIVTDSDIMGIKAHVEAQATASIKSTTSGTTQNIDVKITKATDLRDQATNMSQLITRIGARIVANANGGTIITKGLARKDWLQLTYGDNKEFRDLLCAVTGIATLRRQESGNQEYVFTPAYIGSVSPLASPEQYKEELGQGRTLTTRVDLVDVISRRVIATSPGTIIISSVSPIAAFKDALTGEVVNIRSDSAWQVKVSFPNLAKNQDKLSGSKTFYVNHKTKKFDAIVEQAAKQDAMSPSLPPVVLISR
jgi:hypothetical protein